MERRRNLSSLYRQTQNEKSKAATIEHKCINCINYNRCNKNNINENHSELSKECHILLAVLARYRRNIEY